MYIYDVCVKAYFIVGSIKKNETRKEDLVIKSKHRVYQIIPPIFTMSMLILWYDAIFKGMQKSHL